MNQQQPNACTEATKGSRKPWNTPRLQEETAAVMTADPGAGGTSSNGFALP